MKSSYLTVLAISTLAFLVQSAQATLLFSEGFNYTSGSAIQNQINPGNSATWTGGNAGLTIGSGNLTYAGLQDLGGNELSISNGTAGSTEIQFANQTSGQIYYSFLFNPTVINGGNNYFTALNPGTSTPNGGADAMNAYYYADGHIRVRANAQSAAAGTGPILTLGTTYLVVEEIDLDAKTASLWINPTPGAAAPTATASLSGITATAIDDVGFKAQAGTGAFLVDNLLIGTTWADVTPSSIPEPSTLALAALGVLGLATRLRRR